MLTFEHPVSVKLRFFIFQITMDSVRNSTSSEKTSDSSVSTAVGNTSVCTSPRIGGRGERRTSLSIKSSRSTTGTTISRVISNSTASTSGDSDEEEDGSPSPRTDDQGWPNLANTMAMVPEFAAFPRFKNLNVRNLLYYETEIEILQKDLLAYERTDELCFAKRADLVMGDKELEQYKLIIQLRTLLREYNEALLQYSQVSALPGPEAYNMASLRKWLVHNKGGACMVRGVGGGPVSIWGDLRTKETPTSLWSQVCTVIKALVMAEGPQKDQQELDLVTTHPQAKVDNLTKWLVYYCVPLWWTIKDRYHQRKEARNPDVESKGNGLEEATNTNEKSEGDKVQERESPDAGPEGNRLKVRHSNSWNDGEGGKRREVTLESISEAKALRFTSGLSTVIACLIPVVAITVLTQLSETRDLLLCITGFAVIFAVGLIFLTQGTSSRTEIFAATAAFSAVMVVFISQPVIKIPIGGQSVEISK